MSKRLAFPLLIAIVVVVGAAATASGELNQQGNLRLAFNGRIAPKKLPRKVPAPVSMQFSGSIRTADGGRPPELRKISIAFNRFGRVSTVGLPTCESSELEQTTSKGALADCSDALVGHGNFRAFVTFSGSPTLSGLGGFSGSGRSETENLPRARTILTRKRIPCICVEKSNEGIAVSSTGSKSGLASTSTPTSLSNSS